MFRGPNIALGYHKRPTATKASWDDDGWFHTGDLGHLDEDERLSITGRKKDIIITAGGKNIAPLPIEEKISGSRFVSHALVYGEGKPYCIALITLEEGEVQKAIGENSKPLHERGRC